MGGTTTIATSDPKLDALKLQTSSYGQCIPVFGGMQRVPLGIIYYTDFTSIPNTSTQSNGGKGGVRQTNTTYTYTASLVMSAGYVPVRDVPRVWRDKDIITAVTPVVTTKLTQAYTVPTVGGTVQAVVTAPATWSGSVKVSTRYYSDGMTERVLADGADYTVSATGSYTFKANRPWMRLRNVSLTVTLTYQVASSGSSQSALSQIGGTLITASDVQTAPSWVTSLHPTEAYNYRGHSLIHVQAYPLGSSSRVPNHSIEAVGPGAYSVSSSSPDCDPVAWVAGLAVNDIYGGRLPTGAMDVASASDFVVAAGLLMSPLLTTQQRLADVVDSLCRMANLAPQWAFDKLRLTPYADTAVTGNGVTFTPSVTPAYDLTADHFIPVDGQLIQIERKLPEETFNHVRVEYSDRSNFYNKAVAEAKNDADISANGLRTMPTISAPWICDGTIATRVAQLVLQRSQSIGASYRFQLPFTFDLLEPMDVVRATDPGNELTLYPLRITRVEDDGQRLMLEAEDFPAGAATASLYGTQSAAGYQHNYLAPPGSVTAPVIFEAPADLTSSGLELYIAVKGAAAAWGGCTVWISYDNLTYGRLTRVYGGSRYGAITSVPGATMGVSIGAGALISGSATDATNLSTLCYVGGANPEYLAYAGATLVSAGSYTLGGLNRGAYGTPAAAAHTVGDAFVRVDSAIVKTGALDPLKVGRVIYFKFTSFNIYQAAEESLAAVTAYSYTMTGAVGALSAPPAVKVFNQATDPTTGGVYVPNGTTWQNSGTGVQYVRTGGAWVASVGAGSVDTGQIAANAATLVLTNFVAQMYIGGAYGTQVNVVTTQYAQLGTYEITIGARYTCTTYSAPHQVWMQFPVFPGGSGVTVVGDITPMYSVQFVGQVIQISQTITVTFAGPSLPIASISARYDTTNAVNAGTINNFSMRSTLIKR